MGLLPPADSFPEEFSPGADFIKGNSHCPVRIQWRIRSGVKDKRDGSGMGGDKLAMLCTEDIIDITAIPRQVETGLLYML